MNRSIIAISALAIATALLSANAQANDEPQTGHAKRLSLMSPIAHLPEHNGASELAAAPFSFRLVDKAERIKSRSMSHDWQNGSLTLKMMRAKSQRRIDDLPSANLNRYSVIATDMWLVQEISGRDSLSVGMSYALENRRPSINIAAHNIYRTGNVATTLGWTHDSGFRLSTSLFVTKPIRVSSQPERLVELAGGAPLSAQGASLTASFSPSHDSVKLNYGIDLRSQRISPSDASLFGAPSGRSDARFGFFLRKSF